MSPRLEAPQALSFRSGRFESSRKPSTPALPTESKSSFSICWRKNLKNLKNDSNQFLLLSVCLFLNLGVHQEHRLISVGFLTWAPVTKGLYDTR